MKTAIRPLKAYRLHHCQGRHRTYLAFARCAMPWAHPVRQGESGVTPYALVTRCQPTRGWAEPRVSLWTTQQMAELQSAALCGGGCRRENQDRAHEVIRLEMEP